MNKRLTERLKQAGTYQPPQPALNASPHPSKTTPSATRGHARPSRRRGGAAGTGGAFPIHINHEPSIHQRINKTITEDGDTCLHSGASHNRTLSLTNTIIERTKTVTSKTEASSKTESPSCSPKTRGARGAVPPQKNHHPLKVHASRGFQGRRNNLTGQQHLREDGGTLRRWHVR